MAPKENHKLVLVSERAISSSADDVDLLSINLFASLVKQHEQLLALDATRVIALRLDSDNANEILQSLNVSLGSVPRVH